jgi:hypothetical protein
MAGIQLSLSSGYNIQPERQVASEVTINMYVARSPTGKSQEWLRPMRGRHLFKSFVSAIGGRATYVLNDTTAYAVVGSGFFRIDSFFNISRIGTLNTDTGYAKIVANQLTPIAQVMVVDGVNGYGWDGETFSVITVDGFPEFPIDADYLDGRVLVANGNTNEWYISAINNIYQWLAPDSTVNFETITSRTDLIAGVGVLHRRIFLFGRLSMESWYDAGRPVFPFDKDNNFAVDIGLESAASLAVGFGRMFFLSNTDEGVGSFMRMTDSSYYPEPISGGEKHSAVDYLLSTLTKPEEATSYITKTQDGHIHYITNFTTDNITLVYDDTADAWYLKQSLDGGRDKAQAHFYLNGKHCTIGYNNNKLYEESDEFSDDDGEAIKRVWRSAVLSDKTRNRVRLDRLRVDINQAMGALTTSDDLLKIFLRFSGDGGMTFNNSVDVPARIMGNFDYMPTFRRIGKGRAPVIELTHISKAKFSIIGLWLDYEILPE